MESRRGIVGLPFGEHLLELQVSGKPTLLMGAFSYDTRANHDHERTVYGLAAPGDRVTFNPPFGASPSVICSEGLAIHSINRTEVIFEGSKRGNYQIIGEH